MNKRMARRDRSDEREMRGGMREKGMRERG